MEDVIGTLFQIIDDLEPEFEEIKKESKIIKQTQTSLGQFVKKPPLTEKLLNKPPFR